MSADNVSSKDGLTETCIEIIRGVLKDVLGEETYNSAEVHKWSSKIVNECLKKLVSAGGSRKYIISSIIMENVGQEPFAATSSYWDNKSDGHCIIRWNNSTMRCIVCAYMLQI